jgi:hypothetical protein
MPESSTIEMVKIFFEPPSDPAEDWHTHVESMFATPVPQVRAPGGQVYRLENSPWYAFGVSWQDEVCGERRHEIIGEGSAAFETDTLYFTRVWKHAGHSTYTLFLQNDHTTESPKWLDVWPSLKQLGCTYEGMNSRLLAVDVEPGNDLDKIEEIFEKALVDGVFAYQTQHRFSLLK